MVTAMIQYGQDYNGRKQRRNMTLADLQVARQYLDAQLMQVFYYQHPELEK